MMSTIKTYHFEISARKIGAIGIWQAYRVTVEASDYDEAVRKLYDTYEHISVLHYRIEQEAP